MVHQVLQSAAEQAETERTSEDTTSQIPEEFANRWESEEESGRHKTRTCDLYGVNTMTYRKYGALFNFLRVGDTFYGLELVQKGITDGITIAELEWHASVN